MENKETCKHKNVSYGRLSEYFIIDCIDCKEVLRIDDMLTQKKIMAEFELTCECGKKQNIEQKSKETCKWDTSWTYVKPGCRECYIPNHEFIYCPYCGREIEEVQP